MGYTQKLGLLAQSVFQDSSLNVGIGAAPSGTYKFEVTGTAKVSSTLLVSGVATIGGLTSTGVISLTPSTFSVGSASAADGNSLTIQAANSNYLLRFKNAAGTSIGGFYYDGTNLIADSPSWKFVNAINVIANGSIFGTTSTSGATLILQAGTSNRPITFKNAAGGDGSLFVSGTSTSLNYSFNTYSVGDAFTIINNGNVGIGTSSPAQLLTLYKSDNTIMRLEAGAATTNHWDIKVDSSARIFILNESTSNGAYLSYNSASGWTSTSDARWKTDWSNLEGSLNLINKLNIGKYKMLNNDKELIENARWDYGVKAQELLDIIPDAVDIPNDENDKYGVIHNIVFYNAVKAIQELSAQNQDLKSRLDKAGL